ncbi:molecular chaperone, partial [Collimonas humicola]
ALRVSNPSAYNLTFTGFKINGDKEQTKAGMVLPFSSSDFPLTAISTPQPIDVSYTTINDYGGETPEVAAKVAVGAAVAVQPAAAAATGSTGK